MFMGTAAWEYVRLLKTSGFQPARLLTIAGVTAIILGRAWDGFESTGWLLSLFTLTALGFHLVSYERGRDQAGSDFGTTMGGTIYIGFIGAYLISLRNLPQGMWWVFLVLPSVWLADGFAYFVGRRFGNRKLCPRLSPKKTWEGYIGGIVIGTLLTLALAWGMQAAVPESGITPLRGLIIGLLMGIFPTLGDLGESMFKRQAGVKDSSNLIPGHGGFFDRIDSWLWACVIGYYIITWFWL
jgi:phosphatidate cytidylyltransferase